MNILPLINVSRVIRAFYGEMQERYRYKKNVDIVTELFLASKCKNGVIVDCGFNQGVVAGGLLRDLPEFSLVGFEIQQDIEHFSAELKSKHPGRDINVIYSAVCDYDGEIEYFEPAKWGKNYKGGTTTVNNKESMSVDYSTPKTAPCIDFAEWVSKNLNDSTFSFVKIDIEGGEYDLIEHLIKTGSIDKINVMAIEWHAHKFPEPQRSKYLAVESKLKSYAAQSNIVVLDWY